MVEAEAAKTIAGVKVLGSGCAKCHALEDATRAALAELHMETTIDHVTDFSQIATYGVIKTDEPQTLDFSWVRGFLVTNVCIVQRSAA